MYYPDEWCLVRIEGTDPHWRVFGSWRGGYLDGDSWRLNSGVTSVQLTGSEKQILAFSGHTGSVYECSIHAQGIRSPYNSSVLNNMAEKSQGTMLTVEPMSVEDILEIDWSK